jgi:hypothetical protein
VLKGSGWPFAEEEWLEVDFSWGESLMDESFVSLHRASSLFISSHAYAHQTSFPSTGIKHAHVPYKVCIRRNAELKTDAGRGQIPPCRFHQANLSLLWNKFCSKL